MRLLIIGHGRHGKDTVAEILRDNYGIKFVSSSYFATEKAVWPIVNKSEVWDSPKHLYEDRSNHRELFFHAIRAYNLIPGIFLAEEMFKEGYDCYVGMRSLAEFNNSKDLFDLVIWVDASKRLPPEPHGSMELTAEQATYIVDNNGDLQNLYQETHTLANFLGLSLLNK